MRRTILLIACLAALEGRADLTDQVIARATELTGPSFQSCGDTSTDAAEDCFLAAYERKLPAIGFFAIHGASIEAAQARALTAKGELITISAYSNRPGLTEERCRHPFLAVEFTKQRVRCKEKYRRPLGASILKSRPVWLTRSEPHPKALDDPMPPPSVCPANVTRPVIAQLLVDQDGRVPEVELVVVPPGCDAKQIESVLKRWRYPPPMKNGQPIATVEVIQMSFKR